MFHYSHFPNELPPGRVPARRAPPPPTRAIQVQNDNKIMSQIEKLRAHISETQFPRNDLLSVGDDLGRSQ